eukprot:Rhum_TRINITY_DN9436_c0_g1::Rhum_TRINITY_DN9436_c0_g1_i1::g.33280::m.33280
MRDRLSSSRSTDDSFPVARCSSPVNEETTASFARKSSASVSRDALALVSSAVASWNARSAAAEASAICATCAERSCRSLRARSNSARRCADSSPPPPPPAAPARGASRRSFCSRSNAVRSSAFSARRLSLCAAPGAAVAVAAGVAAAAAAGGSGGRNGVGRSTSSAAPIPLPPAPPLPPPPPTLPLPPPAPLLPTGAFPPRRMSRTTLTVSPSHNDPVSSVSGGESRINADALTCCRSATSMLASARHGMPTFSNASQAPSTECGACVPPCGAERIQPLSFDMVSTLPTYQRPLAEKSRLPKVPSHTGSLLCVSSARLKQPLAAGRRPTFTTSSTGTPSRPMASHAQRQRAGGRGARATWLCVSQPMKYRYCSFY